MRIVIRNALLLLAALVFAQFASADVSGNWSFAVSLGDAGGGNAEITMAQEAEGKISGSYSGQLANAPIAGTYEGKNFEFAFISDALGVDITYRGELEDDGSVRGSVIVQGQTMGTFTGKKKT
ncbi:MAG: hypothetical protein P8N61_08535 [Porticoccaceae bacterium]|nr:hypothetical protein [Porticoccaceae bacterium]|tara:strand:- start:2760 stop:3128 length:369 start_codon:yes stop_codon:yes gene_type:complete